VALATGKVSAGIVPARARAPAPHGDGLAAYAFDLGEGFGLAVMPDFDHAGSDQDDGAYRRSRRQGDVAIRGRQIGMDAAHTRCDHESQDSEQQAHGESEQGQQESY